MQPEEAFGLSRAEGLDLKQILYCCTLYVNKKERKASRGIRQKQIHGLYAVECKVWLSLRNVPSLVTAFTLSSLAFAASGRRPLHLQRNKWSEARLTDQTTTSIDLI